MAGPGIGACRTPDAFAFRMYEPNGEQDHRVLGLSVTVRPTSALDVSIQPLVLVVKPCLFPLFIDRALRAVVTQ